jgi:DNA modification methylase
MNNSLKWQLLNGDCIEVMKSFPENKIDLAFTSPPYEDLRKYHKSKNLIDADYVEFITNVSYEVYRVLRNGGSFILNIQSGINQKTKQRSLSVHKIIINLVEKIGFAYIEPYIWVKTSSIPYNSKLRCYNAFEYCLWFSKGVDNVTFNTDNIRRPYTEATIKRLKYKCDSNFGNVNQDGTRVYGEEKKIFHKINPKGALHSNVLHLSPCTGLNKNHPAQMQPKLAEFFVKVGSNPGDIILDPFVGSGTTMIEALKHGCNSIGIELSDQYTLNTFNTLSTFNNLFNPTHNNVIIDSQFNYIK